MTPSPVLDRCFFIPKEPPVLIQLGRYGDLLLLFPAFHLIYKSTGLKPVIIVSTEYADIFDGISYADPYPIKGNWYMDLPKARQIAEREFGGAIIPFWWGPGERPNDVPQGPLVLQCHGHAWGVDMKKWPDFGTSMWARAGFTREQMISEPLVIDRRNREREADLVKAHIHGDKPVVLYNFTGISSPFGYVPEVLRAMAPFQQDFNLIDLGRIRATRIYDLLGLYDRAVGLITIDTSTAHLAPGSSVPTVWFTVDGWSSSVPRGNVALHVKYSKTPAMIPEFQKVLESWKHA